jgi:transposase
LAARTGMVRAPASGAMKPYHSDLRKRIVDAYKKAEGSVRELAVRFKVAPGTVQNYLTLERETGSVEPHPHGGGPVPKLDDAGVRELRAVVDEKNDRTLDEIARELDRRRNVLVGRTTVWRALDRLGLTRKKRRSAPRNRIGPKSGRSVKSSSGRSTKPIRRACSTSTSSASA